MSDLFTTPTLRAQVFGQSDRGRVRKENEDSFLIDEARGLFAVADGLGGLPEGALASRLTVEGVHNHFESNSSGRPDYKQLFTEVNRSVHALGRELDADYGIGSTLTLVHLVGGEARIAHVGDCCVLLFRGESCAKLTTDHTMEEEIFRLYGPEPDFEVPEAYAHTLTRCIGQKETLEVDLLTERLQPGDRLLLCSDGITKVLSREELLTLNRLSTRPQGLLRRAIDLANAKGGPDNSTGIAVFLS